MAIRCHLYLKWSVIIVLFFSKMLNKITAESVLFISILRVGIIEGGFKYIYFILIEIFIV